MIFSFLGSTFGFLHSSQKHLSFTGIHQRTTPDCFHSFPIDHGIAIRPSRKLKICKIAVLTALSMGPCASQAQTPPTSPPATTTIPAINHNKPQNTDPGRWPMYIAAARHMQVEDFDWIEAKRAELLVSQELDADGEPQLIWLYQGIAKGLTLTAERERQPWDKVTLTLDRWQKRHPKSLMAKLARIDMRITKAWEIRGGDSAPKTPKDNMRIFNKELLIARGELNALSKVAYQEPYWISLQGLLNAPLNASEEEVALLMEYAVKTFPAYHHLLTSGSNYHMPIWHGNPDSLERYARRISAAAPAKDREIVYAKINEFASIQGYPRAFFVMTKADWPTIKAGWEKITAAYPTQQNIQFFLKMACLAADKQATRAQLEKKSLATPFITQIYPEQDFGGCQHWAYQP